MILFRNYFFFHLLHHRKRCRDRWDKIEWFQLTAQVHHISYIIVVYTVAVIMRNCLVSSVCAHQSKEIHVDNLLYNRLRLAVRLARWFDWARRLAVRHFIQVSGIRVRGDEIIALLVTWTHFNSIHKKPNRTEPYILPIRSYLHIDSSIYMIFTHFIHVFCHFKSTITAAAAAAAQ